MGRPVALLSHQERVDPPGLAYERDVRRRVRPQGLQERDVRRTRQMPVLRVADHEIQDVLTGGEHDDRRVTDPGAEPVDPVLALLGDRHSEEGFVVLLLGGMPRQGSAAKRSVRRADLLSIGDRMAYQLLALGVGVGWSRLASTSRARAESVALDGPGPLLGVQCGRGVEPVALRIDLEP